ncbi:MAG: hypothetical protein IKY04_06230 [Lachnospiraceae bacterium]|nr:hypothetical protein [Lachnospiraceae bacterium]
MRRDDDFEMLDLDNDTSYEEGGEYYEDGEYYEEEYYEEEYPDGEYYEEEYYEEKRPAKRKDSKARSLGSDYNRNGYGTDYDRNYRKSDRKRSRGYDRDYGYMNEGKKKKKVFWPIYFIFVSLMVLGWLAVIMYCKNCLVKYEASQPENVIADIAKDLSAGKLDGFNFTSGSRFESGSVLEDTYFKSLDGKEITFEKAAGSTGTRPIFNLYAGDKSIATVTLKATSQEPMMLLLTAQTWAIESVAANYETGDTGVTVKVPSDYKVFVNGIEADDRELVDASAQIEDFANVAPYVTVPTMAEYRIDGLMFAPEIKVTDANGNDVECAVEGSTYTATFATADMPAELQSMVLDYAEKYTNFFSGDLPGCHTSIDCLRPMFTKDSYFYAPAEIYRCEDMGFYSAHTEPVFSNESVTNYTPITDEFFYVDVYFEKNLHLTRTGEDRVDVTNTRYYYVLEDGNWKIADMKQNI